jgi:hypothetical protein
LKTSSCCAIIVNIFRAKVRNNAQPAGTTGKIIGIHSLFLTFQRFFLGKTDKKA